MVKIAEQSISAIFSHSYGLSFRMPPKQGVLPSSHGSGGATEGRLAGRAQRGAKLD